MDVAYALKKAGKNLDPGRPDEGAQEPEQRRQIRSAYPGIKLQTGPKDNFPIEQLVFIKWGGGATGDVDAVRQASTARSARTADVVVIGGGALGAATAFHLGRLGVRDVVLLERDALASGSTSKSAGGIRAQFADELNIRIALRSLDEFESFADEISFRQHGYLFLLDQRGGRRDVPRRRSRCSSRSACRRGS